VIALLPELVDVPFFSLMKRMEPKEKSRKYNPLRAWPTPARARFSPCALACARAFVKYAREFYLT